MSKPIVTATYDRDLELMKDLGGRTVLLRTGVTVEVAFPLHDHEAALEALDRAVADVRAQIEETR